MKKIVVLIAGLAIGSHAMHTDSHERILDDFQTLENWVAHSGNGTQAAIFPEPGKEGPALGLSYMFGDAHGYALASKTFDLRLPENFEFTFFVKRSAPQNSFEFKVIDPDGNTFMKKWYAFASVGKWEKVSVPKRELLWTWGSNAQARLETAAKIEFVVVGQKNEGQVRFDQLSLEPLQKEESLEQTVRTPNGVCPRWLSDEQAYWTMVGVDGDDNEALFAEDGSIESLKRGFSILPLLQVNGQLLTRNEADITQTLEQDCLPIPSVIWETDDIKLHIRLFAHGQAGASTAYVTYTVTNPGMKHVDGRLLLLIQPYQIYPPWQGGGGLSLITNIAYLGDSIAINGERSIRLPLPPDGFRATSDNEVRGSGARSGWLDRWFRFRTTSLNDSSGFASGTIEFDFHLEPGASRNIHLLLPLHTHSESLAQGTPPDAVAHVFTERLQETLSFWSGQVNRVRFGVDDPDLIDTLNANVAYNLVTRDGAALQPGSRSYDKAWMRDGSIAALALLETGHPEAARDFIEWFAGFQQDSGEVPPIIDTKAADPLWEEKQNNLVEYDSQGEFIWIVCQYYRFTGDRAFLERMFPRVIKALEFLVHLRARRLTADFQDGPPEKRRYYGILPESTSHEGYYMKHSYWDDFWALKGWIDARAMAVELGRADRLEWIDAEYTDFKKCVYESIARVMEEDGISYIPGCAELADLDPTSTAASIIYCDQLDNLPSAALAETFDRFFADLQGRLAPNATFRFTPYEMRTVTAYLRMGQKDRTLTLLRFMLNCRRPAGWNHLAEVVDSRYRAPCYIGDMPHTWVGAEYIHAVRCLFAYEKDNALILGAGIDPAWLDKGNPIQVEKLPTAFGMVHYTMEKNDKDVLIHVTGDAHPPAGFIFESPFEGVASSITVNGKKQATADFTSLPADIRFSY